MRFSKNSILQNMVLSQVVLATNAAATTITHLYQCNGVGTTSVLDSVRTANGALVGGATINGTLLKFVGINDFVQFEKAAASVPEAGHSRSIGCVVQITRSMCPS
jgi:hypothetical protein